MNYDSITWIRDGFDSSILELFVAGVGAPYFWQVDNVWGTTCIHGSG